MRAAWSQCASLPELNHLHFRAGAPGEVRWMLTEKLGRQLQRLSFELQAPYSAVAISDIAMTNALRAVLDLDDRPDEVGVLGMWEIWLRCDGKRLVEVDCQLAVSGYPPRSIPELVDGHFAALASTDVGRVHIKLRRGQKAPGDLEANTLRWFKNAVVEVS